MKTLFTKHAKAFTSMEREVTKSVHFDSEGNAWLTDSIKLLCFKHFEAPGNPRAETLAGRKMDIETPQFRRLIPDNTVALTGIDLKELEKALLAAIALNKLSKEKSPEIRMSEEDGKLIVTYNEPFLGVKMRWEIGECEISDYYQHFNPVFLLDCVKVIKDSKETFTFEVVTGTPLRPSYFHTTSLIVLLLPIKPR